MKKQILLKHCKAVLIFLRTIIGLLACIFAFAAFMSNDWHWWDYISVSGVVLWMLIEFYIETFKQIK